MRRGGYHATWVQNALRAATTGYCRMVQKELQGETPVNRPEYLGRQARTIKSITGKATWFQKQPKETSVEERKDQQYINKHNSKNKRKTRDKNLPSKPETVLFAPHTPGGGLRRILQKVDSKVIGTGSLGE